MKLNQSESDALASTLDAFKTNIDLRIYAAAKGYELDPKESWRGSAVMRHSDGDKIIISRQEDGHFVYWSVRNESDHGTIIDFVKHRQSNSRIGQVCQELRNWADSPAKPPQPILPALKKVPKDRQRIQQQFNSMRIAHSHPYLQLERAIPEIALRYWRFNGMIRSDRRGNAIFPHHDTEGLCGYEIKNRDFTSFAPGGTKGLWLSRTIAEDNCLVTCESAIDALSRAVLFPDGRARYASISGKPTLVQFNLLRLQLERMPAGSAAVAAMDADEPGRALAAFVHQALMSASRTDITFKIEEPDGFKDWNDQLRDKQDRSRYRHAHEGRD